MADLITLADEEVEDPPRHHPVRPVGDLEGATYVNCTARCLSTPIYRKAGGCTPRPALRTSAKL